MEPPLAEYKDALGKPNQGFHSTRIPILDVALWDVLGTVVIGLAIAYFTNLSPFWTVAALFILATFLHWLFGVKTKAVKTLGLL